MEPDVVIREASEYLRGMEGHTFEQLTIHKPSSLFEALNMFKITSKISSIVGNLLEIDATEALRAHSTLGKLGEWIRQDPDFPDVLLDWAQPTRTGFEIKAWYPLSTEITGRFKDSQTAFIDNAIHVVLFAWLPQHLLWGKPVILKIAIVPGQAIAAARDMHYHNPPDYVVVEPRDTSERTRNLQQRNTSGYKWQSGDVDAAKKIVKSWGRDGAAYSPDTAYQLKLIELRSKFSYRLDTNYGKMDRVVSEGVENFKSTVLEMIVEGKTIGDWIRLLRRQKSKAARLELASAFNLDDDISQSGLSAP